MSTKPAEAPALSQVFPRSNTAPGISTHPKARLPPQIPARRAWENRGVRTHRRTPARGTDSPAASTQCRLAPREVLRFAQPWTRSLTGAGSPEPLNPCTPQAGPGERRGCEAARLSHPPILVYAAQGRPSPSLLSGVALQDRPATRFPPEPSHRSRGKMRTETQIDGYRSTRMQTRQDRPWEVVTSPCTAKRFLLHRGCQ